MCESIEDDTLKDLTETGHERDGSKLVRVKLGYRYDGAVCPGTRKDSFEKTHVEEIKKGIIGDFRFRIS